MKREDIKVGKCYEYSEDRRDKIEIVDISFGIVYMRTLGERLANNEYDRWLSIDVFLRHWVPVYEIEGFEV